MSRPAHGPATLAAFQDGEQRLLFARYRNRPDAGLYYLENGTAGQVRDWARTHLECFLPDCTDRWLTTVSRSRGRDGFRHRGGAGRHEPEGLFHQQAKALLLRWASRVLPDVAAAAEQRTSAGERRADVMLTWPTGQQVALEVQYAPLTVEAWRDRHRSYRAAGIVDVWLFGHLRPYLRAATSPAFAGDRDGRGGGSSHAAAVQLGAVHRAVLEAGLPLLWVNPVIERIGYAWEQASPRQFLYAGRDQWDGLILDVPARASPHSDYPYRDHLHSDQVLFGAEPLDVFTLDTSGHLVSPHTAGLRANLDRLIHIEQDRERRHTAGVERRDRAARVRAERAAQRRADDARRAGERAVREVEHARRWAAQLPVWRAAWKASALHGQISAQHQGLPAAVTLQTAPVEGLLTDPEHWHAVIHQDVLIARTGQDVGINDIYRSLRARGIHFETRWPSLVRDTVTAYLEVLETAGHLLLAADGVRSNGSRASGGRRYRVVGDAAAVAARAAQQQRRREQAHAEEQARQQADREHQARERLRVRAAWRAHLPAPAPDPSTYSAAPPPGTPAQPVGHPPARMGPPARCRSCGGVLAEALTASGRHVLC